MVLVRNLRRLVLLISPFALLLQACQNPALPQGHFQGTFLNRVGNGISQSLVSSDLSYPDSSDAKIQTTDFQNRSVLTVDISNLGSDHLTLNLKGVLNAPIQLQYSEGCYRDDSQNPTVSFCYGPKSFLLEVFGADHRETLTLSGQQFATEQPLPFETPKPYTLSEAIRFSMSQSFSSRLQFEQAMQAHLVAKANYLNLLPHLNLSDVLSNLTPSVTSLLQSVGDLAPFLLPSRWIQANESSLAAQAQDVASTLMQLDSGVGIEGLAYVLLKDESIVQLFRDLMVITQKARDTAEQLEKVGTLPPESTDHLTAQILSMQLDVEGLLELIKLDKEAIAQAMGFFNPDAVSEIQLVTEASPIELAVALDPKQIADQALSRSFELQQIDDLIAISQNQKDILYFNWLDPSGDLTEGLGLNLNAQVEVAENQIQTLLLQRQQLEQNISQSVYSAVNDFNVNVSSYPEIQKAVDLNSKRLNYVFSQVVANSSISTLDVQGVLQDALSMSIRQKNCLANYRIARAKVDRALLQGAYQKLPVPAVKR